MSDTVAVTKLANGFLVSGDTSSTHEQVYVPNLKGVVAQLYKMFEGKTKLTPDQVRHLKGLAGKDDEKG